MQQEAGGWATYIGRGRGMGQVYRKRQGDGPGTQEEAGGWARYVGRGRKMGQEFIKRQEDGLGTQQEAGRCSRCCNARGVEYFLVVSSTSRVYGSRER